ncbi:MAG: hypothetical protein CO094_06305 [Anaerolineae bacterium CG_4_9_14_3_um_filter_57_17]|nr:hypothetical protein [bacterium]NCT21624.1 hypothetical protein [bacterium]OIO85770.1 MAG: hypothetical protein AUK01_05105 [Anaerolineae bacterium CG2_30_57_67]PJB66663.1 MAG: hypothetical protein CO094_06305 [Anaerolineae bacterium CG_4_9_14_3_um_filter_57_17]
MVDGTLLGEWQPANAIRDDTLEVQKHVRGLLSKKYGLAFHLFALMGKMQKAKHTVLRVTLSR